MHECKYTYMQEQTYETSKVCKFLSMWFWNHVSMPPYHYVIISYCHTRVQLRTFSSARNLAILQVGPGYGMILYLDMISPWSSDYKPLLLQPDELLKVCKQQPFGVCKLSGGWQKRCVKSIWKVSLSCLKVSGKFLKMSRMLPHSGSACNLHLS